MPGSSSYNFALKAAWDSQQLTCISCERRMYFPRFESKHAFLAAVTRRGRMAESIFLKCREATVDHITPQADGGGHEVYNLRIMCAYCNQSRSNTGGHPYGISSYEDYESEFFPSHASSPFNEG